MKVAIFSDTFYPKTDGMSTSSQNLAASLARQGHQVLVVAPKPSLRRKEAFSLPGVEIVWLASQVYSFCSIVPFLSACRGSGSRLQ